MAVAFPPHIMALALEVAGVEIDECAVRAPSRARSSLLQHDDTWDRGRTGRSRDHPLAAAARDELIEQRIWARLRTTLDRLRPIVTQ
jgi:hypothetical protein